MVADSFPQALGQGTDALTNTIKKINQKTRTMMAKDGRETKIS